MLFLEAQQNLQGLSMDDSTEYATGGTKNKLCNNNAYRDLWDQLKNSTKVKRRAVKPKVAVTFTNKVWALPSDFDVVDVVSTFDFQTDSDLDGISEWRYFNFEVRWEETAKSMYIQSPESTLYVSYMPIRTNLTWDTDKFLLPVELHPCITDFAMYWYYRMTRDDAAAASALQLAQSVLQLKLATLW